jgi:hypothetical protein
MAFAHKAEKTNGNQLIIFIPLKAIETSDADLENG